MFSRLLTVVLVFGCAATLSGQDEPVSPAPTTTSDSTETRPVAAEPSATEQVKETADKLATQTKEEVEKIAKTVDQDPRARDAAAGILQPIYKVAESLAFPAFHWMAFALMSAGVVSYALQLVLGKLVVLTRMGLSPKEIISDAVGLSISVIGLVLTTQAAAENSTFTQSPAAVISATLVGALAGIILYWWGQSQELQATAGRSLAATTKKS